MQVDQLINASYSQSLSQLIAITGNIVDAEDALQIAIESALTRWTDKPPDSPTAWLIRVGRNAWIDTIRRQKKQVGLPENWEPTVVTDLSEVALHQAFNDDMLRLIFTSCHPALNEETQIILSLKHILGLNVEDIANAMLVKPKTIEQRLTRAKKKIVSAKIPYQTPEKKQWHPRLMGVLKTIYLLFNEGYFATNYSGLSNHNLCREAIRLTRLVHQCIKDDAHILGLLALLLHQYARRDARVDSKGKLILLDKQNRQLWHANEIAEANVLVEKSIMLGGRTTYGIQAAIAALHNNAKSSDNTDWRQIYFLYQELMRVENQPVVQLNAYVALAKFDNIKIAIEKISSLSEQLQHYRHYHTALAALLYQDNQFQQAKQHYQTAYSLSSNTCEQQFILNKIDLCEQAGKTS